MSTRWVTWLLAGGVLAAAAGAAATGPTRRMDPVADELGALAADLAARTAAIERREQGFTQRSVELKAAEDRLAARTAELETLRTQITALQATVDAERVIRVATVMKAVEGMKPTAAAGMIAELDTELAIEVLSTMNRSKAGKILGALPPATAATLAEGMAARKLP